MYMLPQMHAHWVTMRTATVFIELVLLFEITDAKQNTCISENESILHPVQAYWSYTI